MRPRLVIKHTYMINVMVTCIHDYERIAYLCFRKLNTCVMCTGKSTYNVGCIEENMQGVVRSLFAQISQVSEASHV